RYTSDQDCSAVAAVAAPDDRHAAAARTANDSDNDTDSERMLRDTGPPGGAAYEPGRAEPRAASLHALCPARRELQRHLAHHCAAAQQQQLRRALAEHEHAAPAVVQRQLGLERVRVGAQYREVDAVAGGVARGDLVGFAR